MVITLRLYYIHFHSPAISIYCINLLCRFASIWILNLSLESVYQLFTKDSLGRIHLFKQGFNYLLINSKLNMIFQVIITSLLSFDWELLFV